jgi:antitoxin FitA
LIRNECKIDQSKVFFGGIWMPVNVSIKNVPDDILEELRKWAKRHHRSLQGELMVILEEAAGPAVLSVNEAESLFNAMKFTTGSKADSQLTMPVTFMWRG